MAEKYEKYKEFIYIQKSGNSLTISIYLKMIGPFQHFKNESLLWVTG
jgi:hypothetical protein